MTRTYKIYNFTWVIRKFRVLFEIPYLFIVFFLLLSTTLFAQVKIDSTSKKTPYGPKNTFYTSYKKVNLSDTTFFKLDTIPTLYSRYEQVDIQKRKYQDLGNLGSALHPIFLQKTSEIGVTPGYNAYNKYFIAPDSTRFYDTRSPYTQLDILLGGVNRNKVNVIFSRNVNKRWNVGMHVKSIIAAKQISGRSREDLYTSSLGFSFFTRYISKNDKYKLLSSVHRIRHLIDDSGGLVPLEIQPKNNYYGYNSNAAVWTNTVLSGYNQVSWRVYQEYGGNKSLVFYHQYDYTGKVNTHGDSDPVNGGNARDIKSESNTPTTGTPTTGTDTTDEDSGTQKLATKEEIANTALYKLYPNLLFGSKVANNENRFYLNVNKLGVKGGINSAYYNFYVKHRYWANTFSIRPNISGQHEYYAGTVLKYALKSDKYALVEGEAGNDGQYKGEAVISHPWFDINYQLSSRRVPLLYNHNFSYFDIWENNFVNENKQYATVRLKWSFWKSKIALVGKYVQVDKPLVFNYDRIPEQPDVTISQLQGGVEWYITFFSYLKWAGNVLYTVNDGGERYAPVPEVFTMQEFYFDKPIFNRVMHAQIGFHYHWKSDYYAKAYATDLQSFYLQDTFLSQGYPVIDFFIRFKAKRAKAVFKIMNLRQIYEYPREGYFPTPYYTGLPFLVDIGFGWMFFN